ncbi:MAG TPA: HisA/HisF-related TIM barrel protein, partial [Myxococcales bacterium]|nr:HisA/HisF-related TIM barrel protein [Myxococcales bacterium]
MTPLLHPAIDLLGGRAVRLHKGDRSTARVYAEDPAAQARAFVEQGARVLHVVDLDAAFGGPRQLALIRRIASAAAPAPVQVGGGIRDLGAAEDTLEAGAARVILGTAAVERPELGGEAVERFGPDRVACGIDIRDAAAAEETLEAGAARVILGTAAVEQPDLARAAVERFGSDRVACGIDIRDGRAAT